MMEKHRHNQSNLYTNVDVPAPKTWEDIAMLTFSIQKKEWGKHFCQIFTKYEMDNIFHWLIKENMAQSLMDAIKIKQYQK